MATDPFIDRDGAVRIQLEVGNNLKRDAVPGVAEGDELPDVDRTRSALPGLEAGRDAIQAQDVVEGCAPPPRAVAGVYAKGRSVEGSITPACVF
jgi:hypothetical protein